MLSACTYDTSVRRNTETVTSASAVSAAARRRRKYTQPALIRRSATVATAPTATLGHCVQPLPLRAYPASQTPHSGLPASTPVAAHDTAHAPAARAATVAAGSVRGSKLLTPVALLLLLLLPFKAARQVAPEQRWVQPAASIEEDRDAPYGAAEVAFTLTRANPQAGSLSGHWISTVELLSTGVTPASNHQPRRTEISPPAQTAPAPSGQRSHAVAASFANKPDGQMPQTSLPLCDLKKPGWHGVHEVRPGNRSKPGKQKHSLEAPTLDVPRGHGVHCDKPRPAENEPAAQAAHMFREPA